ncbi:MAG: peptidase [Microthrixaceae bacterium]|nr:peptidase [Microthrixaceae bacterium]
MVRGRGRFLRVLVAGAALLLVLAACTPPPPAAGSDDPPAAQPTTAPTTTAPPETTLDWTTVRSGPIDGFDITLRFAATLPADQVQPVIDSFNAAATRWEQVITADLAPYSPSGFDGCDDAGPVGTIDDVVIDVSVGPGDGPGEVLGSAGFCLRTGTLARAGIMHFDAADVGTWLANGRFERVVLHEMGHVLGIGTMWPYAGLRDTTEPTDPRFTGPDAVAEWNALSASTDTGVPIEAGGGPGTALAHWRESTFRSELMTGWISPGPSPLSLLSIASLADLGYTVDVDGADPYTLGSVMTDALFPGTEAHGASAGLGSGFVLLTPDGPLGSD